MKIFHSKKMKNGNQSLSDVLCMTNHQLEKVPSYFLQSYSTKCTDSTITIVLGEFAAV